MGKILKPLAIVAGVVAAFASAGSILAFGKIAGTFLGVGIKTLNLIAAGLSIASSVLAPRPKAPQASRENIQRLEASVIPRTPRKIWFGHTAGATDIRDQEYTDNQGFLHRFVVVASHKINGVQQIWFDDKLAWTSAGGAQGEYAGYLNVTVINEGSAANAINISARMGNTRRYTGLAYVYLRYKLTGNNKKTQSPFAQSIPSRMTIRGKGALVYDPRLDSTVPGGSGPQRANDQSTWVWSDSASRNPALQLLWWLLGWRINGLLAVGKGIPANRIDLASFIVAANLCDEPVTLAVGGTEPRYRSDQLFSEGDSASVVLDGLRSTMNADLDDVDGKLRLTVFHNDLAVPVANFTDDDYIKPFNWQQTPSLHDTFNIVRGAYTDPSDISLYQPAEYPEVALSSPDGIDRIDSFDLPGVQSVSQAQRLAKTRLQRGQYGGTFSTVLNARGWKVQKNDVVTITLSRLGWTNKLFRVAEMEHRTDGTCPITLREEHVSIYAWDSDEAPAVTPTAPTVYDFSKSAINLDLLSAINTAQFPAEPPSDWAVGSIYIDQTGRKFRFAGRQLTFNGEPLTFYGEPIFTSGYVDAQDQATVAALAAASIAQNLATDAAAIADGKVQTFYQPNAPLDASEGDIWIDTDGGNNQYRYTSGAWVDVQDTGIGQAIADAAGAQATADGKVTTYVSETAPTAEALGDLWFKQSTGELRRWSGSAWGDPLVDLTAAKQVVIVPPLPQTVYRTWQGVIKSSQYPRTLTPQVEQGGVDIRTRNDVSYAITTTGSIAATVNNTNGSADKGRITATNGSSGSIVLTVSIGGLSQPPFTIPFINVDDNPPTTGGTTGGSDSTLEDVTSTSFAPITQQDAGESVFVIDITAGQTMSGIAPLSYIKSGTNTTTTAMVARWQYRLQGSGTWLDFVSGPTNVTGTGAFWNNIDYNHEEGEINVNQSVSGLATGTYECQLIAAKSNTAAGNLQIISGMATVTRSAQPIM
jgi:hypothetical protein